MTTAPDEAIEQISVIANGQKFQGWTTLKLKRALDRTISDFDLTMSERWPGQMQAIQLLPFTAVQIMLGNELLLTGYVDSYVPQVEGTSHTVRVAGRSKTCDLADCEPDIKSGQFTGYTLAQIARSICAPFGIAVVDLVNSNQTFPDATMERCETAHRFLERLGRLCGVLLTDDEQGRLVLTTAGSGRATTAIVQGRNMLKGHAQLTGAKRYSIYIVKGQHGLGGHGKGAIAPNLKDLGTNTAKSAGAAAVEAEDEDEDEEADEAEPAKPAVITQQRATCSDPGVPRFRPHVVMAESQLDQASMQERAQWLARWSAGKAREATVTVRGFRQADGTRWTQNAMVTLTAPFLGFDEDLLIAGVEMSLEDSGKRTTLLLGPPDAFAPDPGEVKRHKVKGAKKKKGKFAPDLGTLGRNGE